jgi:hypothetical protein
LRIVRDQFSVGVLNRLNVGVLRPLREYRQRLNAIVVEIADRNSQSSKRQLEHQRTLELTVAISEVDDHSVETLVIGVKRRNVLLAIGIEVSDNQTIAAIDQLDRRLECAVTDAKIDLRATGGGFGGAVVHNNVGDVIAIEIRYGQVGCGRVFVLVQGGAGGEGAVAVTQPNLSPVEALGDGEIELSVSVEIGSDGLATSTGGVYRRRILTTSQTLIKRDGRIVDRD